MKIFPTLYRIDTREREEVWSVCAVSVDRRLAEVVTTKVSGSGKSRTRTLVITDKGGGGTPYLKAIQKARDKWEARGEKGWTPRSFPEGEK